MNSEWKLRMLKACVNLPLRLLSKLIVCPEPRFPQTKLLLQVHTRMMQVYRLECAQGVFDVPDGNFERLLQVTQALLTRLAEDDRYYRAWLGLAFILAQEQVDEFNEYIGEIKRLIKVQWLTDLDFLPDNAIISHRREFLETALCDYLCNLARMEP